MNKEFFDWEAWWREKCKEFDLENASSGEVLVWVAFYFVRKGTCLATHW